jgi:hypothetical protein
MLREHFELCYPLHKGSYIAPQLLPTERPGFTWEDEDLLQFRFNYAFMPRGLLARLIVRLHHLIEDGTVWRTGVLLARDGARALVRDLTTKKQGDKVIHIAAMGPVGARKELLDMIRMELRAIHERVFPNIEVTEEVPFADAPETAVPYSFLIEQHMKRRNSFAWPGMGDASVSAMLDGVLEPFSEDSLYLPKGVILNIDNSAKLEANPSMEQHFEGRQDVSQEQHARIDFTFSQEWHGLQGSLGVLAEDLEEVDAEAAKVVAKVEDKLNAVDTGADEAEQKAQLKKPMTRLGGLLKRLEDPDDKLGKALKGVENGMNLAQDLAGKYNKIAEWCGMPVVPSAFLKK